SFGRRRQLVSIGLYRLSQIKFPVRYQTAPPKTTEFVPLGCEKSMSLVDILREHPKGIAYRETLGGAKNYPLLVSADKKILSFPPIINSRMIGEVQVGDRDLFVEVTGTDIRMVALTVNILAANLSDRGGKIHPVEILYPYSTDFGRKMTMPMPLADSMTVPADEFSAVLGEKISVSNISSVLKNYGYTLKPRSGKLEVSVPPYRDDLLHPVDVVEDYAISRGYDSFKPEMPSEMTVGGLSAIERFSDQVRDHMVGIGFQEAVSNILTDRTETRDRMELSDENGGEAVAVANVMSQSYSVLRDSIIPALLRVESSSSRSFYPHRIFEVGETARVDAGSPEGTRTELKLAALIAHPGANFSELHSVLDILMYYLDKEYELDPVVHPSFLEGRAGRILIENRVVGMIGEIHPKVLENWQITMPCSAFELHLDPLVPSEIPGKG
ncbi:MAG TPA: phenylalanine--tRNA ligase subunit beta, partial [Nitrospiria bacterium]|nr:phenylalanine--tRNA ligase subunit beta [Nitrospiria bacterium]